MEKGLCPDLVAFQSCIDDGSDYATLAVVFFLIPLIPAISTCLRVALMQQKKEGKRMRKEKLKAIREPHCCLSFN
eukprot:778776-Pelagomonas_calceolata.AAC.2